MLINYQFNYNFINNHQQLVILFLHGFFVLQNFFMQVHGQHHGDEIHFCAFLLLIHAAPVLTNIKKHLHNGRRSVAMQKV